ncbi:HNH endonuclease [Rhodanobacter sp. A1T4]|uniref:HNH endonuclease n=1 Tax=Rhodanobacter sp. A1T4 TaxID=2723087 RepID=UPI00160DCB1E|nr:HNH endonuclease [Rhodanobacter sp. A1T4]MBB6247748.1 hypothetical protein [Rhodanobacter sp. A1T4]
MKVFVVRVNPDTRLGPSYTRYPTKSDYENIHRSSPMNGFEEAVNFLNENGLVRGYLPPKHLKLIRSDDPFALITITAKTASKGGDLVVGVQVGCTYVGENTRVKPATAPKFRPLTWHYRCDSSNSFLLEQPIAGARALVLGKNGAWVRGPTRELKANEFSVFADSVSRQILNKNDKRRFRSALIKTKVAHDQPEGRPSLGDIDWEDLSGTEGKKKLVTHLRRERKLHLANAKRESMLAQTGRLICEACKLDFTDVYGPLGKGVYEVHHRAALSTHGERNTSLKDLAILCANCHRMIHRTNPMLSVEEFVTKLRLND